MLAQFLSLISAERPPVFRAVIKWGEITRLTLGELFCARDIWTDKVRSSPDKETFYWGNPQSFIGYGEMKEPTPFPSNLKEISGIFWSSISNAALYLKMFRTQKRANNLLAPTGALVAILLPLFHITSSRSSKSYHNLLTLLKMLEHLCLYIVSKSVIMI